MCDGANIDDSSLGAIPEGELKTETLSPAAREKQQLFTFSRTSSISSVYASSSSAHNTEDEDDSDHKSNMSYKDRRREAHQLAEQKRRDAIKKGYDDLQDMVPTCQNSDGIGSQKLSKAAVLQRSIDYIQFLLREKKKQEEDLSMLRKDVVALQIMKANYEQIVAAHQSAPLAGENNVSDDLKFQVFQNIMDTQFQSFDEKISTNSFVELSGCVIHWLEECCQPDNLHDLAMNVLQQVTSTH
ncbi:PREDICTED: max-like protein X [Priapulus caudatus]|uniref:Max-like protein X n=1 Tax=Priapulus caudatus TaxID=37621 RepID=A0ABM1EB94_PRICU|nr:PREDICTED: max-like protein X [Priapulus caudatus]XP_014669466.1 PREDICTED: max-like protein X [Priapulus caudatus]